MKLNKIIALLLTVALLLIAMPFTLSASQEVTETGLAKFYNDASSADVNAGYWIFEKFEDYYNIKNAASGYYLTDIDGTLSLAKKDANADSQCWELGVHTDWFGSALDIKNVHTGKYLFVKRYAGLESSSCPLGLWADGTNPQHIGNGTLSANAIFSAEDITEGTKYIIGNAQWSGHLLGADITVEPELEITGTAKKFSDASAAVANNGYWVFEKCDGYYRIKEAKTGFNLTNVDNTLVLAKENPVAKSQLWEIGDWYGTYIYIKNIYSGTYIIIGSNLGLQAEGKTLGIWPEGVVPAYGDGNGSASTNTLADYTDIVEGTKYMIGNTQWEGNFLGADITYESELVYQDRAIGDIDRIADYNGYWVFEEQGEGIVSIKNSVIEKYLAIVDGKVCMIDHNAEDNRQLWLFGEDNGKVSLCNKETRKYLSALTTCGGGTLEDSKCAIGIWRETVIPAWSTGDSYTINGLTSAEEMVYGSNYIIGNATMRNNYIGAEDIETEENTIKAQSPVGNVIVSVANDYITDWLKDYNASGQYTLGSSRPYSGADNFASNGIELRWLYNGVAQEYEVKLSVNSDLSAATVLKTKDMSVTVYDLTVAKTYFWQVSAVTAEGTVVSDIETFYVKQAPRTISIDGVSNTRDIGGYLTEDGLSRVRQGMIYRGANADEITEQGKKKALEVYGINTDFDLRRPSDSSFVGVKSPISDDINYINISGVHYGEGSEYYADANNYAVLANEIKVFSDEENYPVFVHCSAGRDRTGTLCYLINALLGVPEAELYIDYETTFLSKPGWDPIYYTDSIKSVHDFISSKKGDTFADKTATFLIECGVTQSEIDSIRSIMLESANLNKMVGDVNDDGEIDVRDLVRLKKFAADIDRTPNPNADINRDGYSNSIDLSELRKLLLNP